VVLLLALVHQPMVNKLAVSAHHQASKAAATVAVLVVALDSMLVLVVELHPTNHQAIQHQAVEI
jgi:hypothetical protein